MKKQRCAIFEDKCANDKNYRKIRDHCHYTVEYRGAAHSICNLKYSILKEITVIFSQLIKL